MAREHMKSWKVGDVTITRIVEVWDYQDNINMSVADATAEEVIAMKWLHPDYATPDGKQRMNFQGFVVQTPTKNIVVDSCIGAEREREFDVFCDLPEGFIQDLESLGITRHDIDIVMCTHLHFDHVGWNTYKDAESGEYKPTFPNAHYLFGQTEYDAWQILRHDGVHHPGHMIESVDPIVEAGMVDFIEPDHVICEELSCEPSHGHTPGHVHVCISSKGQRGVITGDLMHHPIQCAMPHRTATFDMDKDVGRQTRIDFVKKYADSGVLIIGAHFAGSTAGHINTHGEGDVRFDGIGK